jgi:membrane protein implicated in regulation of membrane protease activity
MLDVFSSFSTLNCVYFIMLLAGIIWTSTVLIGGAVGGADAPDIDVSSVDFDLDHDLSFDHGSVDVSPLSPITIASFVTSFGALGLIATQLFDVPDPASLLVATGGAAVIAGGMFLFYSRVLVAGQGSSSVRMSDIRGSKAEVIIPIPKNGLGRVAFVARGSRTTWSARSVDGKPIANGAIVKIQAVTGNTLLVSRE